MPRGPKGELAQPAQVCLLQVAKSDEKWGSTLLFFFNILNKLCINDPEKYIRHHKSLDYLVCFLTLFIIVFKNRKLVQIYFSFIVFKNRYNDKFCIKKQRKTSHAKIKNKLYHILKKNSFEIINSFKNFNISF